MATLIRSPHLAKIWTEVEILVLGSTTAAVSAALAVHRSGRKVAILADKTYFGEDLAGALHLWPEEARDCPHPLISGAYAHAGSGTARPAALKRYLEKQLLSAGIPFLFACRPVGLLYSAGGVLGGVLAAARTSLFSIRCESVIDATPNGLAGRMAGLQTVARPDRPTSIRWRVFADAVPATWAGRIRELTPSYKQDLKDGQRIYRAFELEIDRLLIEEDVRASSHLARSLLIDESVWVTADSFIDAPPDVFSGIPLVHSLESLGEDVLQPCPSLWIANQQVPMAMESISHAPNFLSHLGERVGRQAAASLSSRAKSKAAGCFELKSGGEENGVDFGFSEVFLRGGADSVEWAEWSFPDWGEFEVVVAGGGTAGAPAAIAAARSGAHTLCLEGAHCFGGVGTLGLISSYWFGNKTGFTERLNEEVSRHDSLSLSKNGNLWHPVVKSAIYHQLFKEAGGTGWLESHAFGVQMTGNRPAGVLVSTPYGCGWVRAAKFVDATGNADLAAAAGASCRLMDGRHAAVQGTGISSRVCPSVLHQNSDHTFVEENDPVGMTSAHVQAREKYPEDFETMPFINSRERRQIHGDVEISPLDILSGRTFPDTIFTAKSNFDTHGFIVHPVFMVVPPDHKPLAAHVPLRCMLPKGLEGLLVTGLGMSAHRDALPVIRMQADVQNQGYAAGLLAARCALNGEDFRTVDLRAFQQDLVNEGILTIETAVQEDSFPMSNEAVAAAAAGSLSDVKTVAILFAHPDLACEGLVERMRSDRDAKNRDHAALILGLQGRKDAADFLATRLEAAVWDEGWDYRGMGQFGASMSCLDAIIIALGRCGESHHALPLVRLANALNETASFSHCRALALATASLKAANLTRSLLRLLDLPGFGGHAFLRTGDMLADSDGDPISTRSRNLALRELYVARGVFLGGDPDGRGRAVLNTYVSDLRGHFARHAAAVLNPMESLESTDLA